MARASVMMTVPVGVSSTELPLASPTVAVQSKYAVGVSGSSSVQLTSVAEARQIVTWYRMRWTIEQVFRSLKAHGLRIEDSQMVEARSFTKLAVVALIAAVRSMQLVLARDGSTGQKINDAVDPTDMPALRSLNTSVEGRTEMLKNPFDSNSLAWFAWVVARLGGWSGYTSRGYKPPGPKTMHHGLLRLDQILAGWRLAIHSADVRLP